MRTHVFALGLKPELSQNNTRSVYSRGSKTAPLAWKELTWLRCYSLSTWYFPLLSYIAV